MFEKSLYDLIRGLRNHKGNEREYIQFSLRECRNEIRGSDMDPDLKATALLKLIYLEMFGHDMSWASFNVLEVMSSTKYLQKRVGYLAAVQSFRPDTEVLMLATNLLKKDISSSSIPTISLPLITLPHIITPSLAISILTDLMPRLSHSSANVRKKTIVTLYRLALVYPEVLRPTWPKIKDMLMDPDEDRSVTAAVVNVVCELGWRRPRDFLPLAPRLFDLLVDGGNNWMAIKIVKLFATLTPLEPRLVKKLLPPLTNLIRQTPAMSLLYECINGIIQGGILQGADDLADGDEVAALCVGKLRGMVAIEGDPNLKYVALLAFNKIVASHPYLVSTQQDVILNCIDDPDISIRLQALDLSSGMIDIDNLRSVVNQLLRQLRESPIPRGSGLEDSGPVDSRRVESAADSDQEGFGRTLHASSSSFDGNLRIPDEYRHIIIRQILEMCSRNTYANVLDFEWYVDLLSELVWLVPSSGAVKDFTVDGGQPLFQESAESFARIGAELQNVAVRVSSIRLKAIRAADSLITSLGNSVSAQVSGTGARAVLAYAAWIVGEYAIFLPDRNLTLDALLLPSIRLLSSDIISAYLQAIPKILAATFTDNDTCWDVPRQTMVSLRLARVVHYLIPLITHPNLEVQERSVELLELMRLAAQAISSQESLMEGPLLLTEAIPSLFFTMELNPIAATAQAKIPGPDNLDVTVPLNRNLSELLRISDEEHDMDQDSAEINEFYYYPPASNPKTSSIAANTCENPTLSVTYQTEGERAPTPDHDLKNRAPLRTRNKDDPFYISEVDTPSGNVTPLHNIIQNSSGTDVDIDSIPIMHLDLGLKVADGDNSELELPISKVNRRQRIRVLAEEDLDPGHSATPTKFRTAKSPEDLNSLRREVGKKSVLQVDSSGIGAFALAEVGSGDAYRELENEREVIEDAEMVRALAEVSRLRLEMQRASERVQLTSDIPDEGILVKKRRKKKREQILDQGTISGAYNASNGRQIKANSIVEMTNSSSTPIDADGLENNNSSSRRNKQIKKEMEMEKGRLTEVVMGAEDQDRMVHSMNSN